MKSNEKYLNRSQDCAWRVIDGSVLVVKVPPGGGNRVYSLNKTGTAIWELADGSRDEREITSSIVDRFEHPSTSDVAGDIKYFTKELLNRGLLEVAGTAQNEEGA